MKKAENKFYCNHMFVCGDCKKEIEQQKAKEIFDDEVCMLLEQGKNYKCKCPVCKIMYKKMKLDMLKVKFTNIVPVLGGKPYLNKKEANRLLQEDLDILNSGLKDDEQICKNR